MRRGFVGFCGPLIRLLVGCVAAAFYEPIALLVGFTVLTCLNRVTVQR